jgi:hypothetical protein
MTAHGERAEAAELMACQRRSEENLREETRRDAMEAASGELSKQDCAGLRRLLST